MASKSLKGGKKPPRAKRAGTSQAVAGAVVAAALADGVSAEEASFKRLGDAVDGTPRLTKAELDGLTAEQLAGIEAPLTNDEVAYFLDPAHFAELGLDAQQFAQLLEADVDEAMRVLHAAARKYQVSKLVQKASAQQPAADSAAPAASEAGGEAAAGGAGGGTGISTLGVIAGVVGAGAIGFAITQRDDEKGDATAPVNRSPSTTNDSITTAEDTSAILTLSDFGTYADAEGTALAAVKIVTLPGAGVLEFNNGTAWVAVTVGQNVSAADITAGKLRFVPAANANGNGYATFTYQVSDGVAFSDASATLTVNVTPVNDAPVNTVPTVTVSASQAANVKLAGLSVADVDGGAITTTLAISNGTLTIGAVTGGATLGGNGTASVTLSGTVAQINASLADLTFRSGPGFLGNATLTVTTNDGGNGGGAALIDTDTLTISVSVAQSGIVSDGYIVNGTVFIDVNGNGKLDQGEPSTTTGPQGQFAFATTVTGPIVAIGGTNADTGLPNLVALKAPVGATAITPLTTLVQTLIATGVSEASANSTVLAALGLPPGLNLAKLDILDAAAKGDAGAFAAQKAAASVVAILNTARSVGTGDAASASESSVLSSLVNTLATSTGTIDLASSSVLQSVFTNAGGAAAASSSSLAASAQAQTAMIQAATSLSGIATAQQTAGNNSGPVANSDAAQVAANGGAVAINVLGNDTDANDDALKVTQINGEAITSSSPITVEDGIVTLLANGQLSFTPFANFSGSTSFLYTVADGKGGAATATVNVTVGPLGDTYLVSQDTIAAATANAASLAASGIDHFDVDGAALDSPLSLTEAQANALVSAGIDFTNDDTITLQAAGTKLSTSLQDLQSLGVDSVAVGAGVTALAVEAGTGGLAALAAGGALPQFDVAQTDAALEVTLNIDAGDVSGLAASAATLGTAGIDIINVGGVTAASEIQISDVQVQTLVDAGLSFAEDDHVTVVASTTLSTSLQNLQALGVDSIQLNATGLELADVEIDPAITAAADDFELTLLVDGAAVEGQDFDTLGDDLAALGVDFLNVADGGIEISETQVLDLVSAGLAFSADSDITLSTAGTEMGTSLAQLQALGVDSVDMSGETVVNIHLGEEGVDVLGGALPQFDEAQDEDDLYVRLRLEQEGDLDELLGVDVLSDFTTPDLYGDLVAALADAGIDELSVNVWGGNAVDVSDGLAAALVEAGMLVATQGTNIVLDGSGAGDHLATSLKTMADLGVDQVVLTDPGVGKPVYVDLGVDDSISEMDVETLITSLDADGDPGTPLFTGSGAVSLVVSSALGETLAGIDGVFDRLAELGFTEIAVLDGTDASVIGQLEGTPIEVKLIGQDDPLYDLLHR